MAVEVEGDHLVVCKLVAGRDPYLAALEATLEEWASPEDEAVWRDL